MALGKPAGKKENTLLQIPGQILVFLGRPFYYLFSYLTLFFLLVFLYTGKGLLIIPKIIFNLFKAVFTTKKKKPRKIKKPKKIKKISFFDLYSIRPILVFLRGIKKVFILILTSRIFWSIVIILSFVFSFWWFILKDLPSPNSLSQRNLQVTTKIYDRNGVLLYKIYKNQNRTPVSLKEIPLVVRQATIAAEDAEFYLHPGFSIKGITRAMIKNVREGKISGGSTITQQLVKNALLTPEKTLVRKIKEIILSVRVELTYTKDEILEMYLNEVSYGGTAYGIQEASQVYFGKDVEKLSLAESAVLAGLPKSPSKYSPFQNETKITIERQKEVLSLMVANSFITSEQKEAAEKQNIVFAQNITEIKAPHFVMYVKKILEEAYGEDVVEKQGLEVITTLDINIQNMAEKVVSEQIESLKPLRVGNGAVVILNPINGEILAMVGSKDYFDTASQGNFNVTTSPRQPGSSIKVVNYAYALGAGYTLSSILEDSPISFRIPGTDIYTPKNYDSTYKGRITLRNALAQSRNIPAVKVLASYGVVNMIEMGRKMGITTWENPSNYGLSLTLGGGEVKLLDLARVYATIADYGTTKENNSIIQIKDYKGRILENPIDSKRSQVLDPGISYLLIDVLKDNVARTPAFGPSSQLVVKNHPEVVVKTGTSNNLKDNLTVGFTKDFLVAVWVGNNDASPMSYIASGITGAAPIFNKIMSNLLSNKDTYQWNIPEGLVKVSVCPLTGTLPCQGCPGKEEWFLKEKVPTMACTFIKKETLEGKILNEAASTQN